jgi:NAD(P)-dependent dehydrogenase (short-subunit alcohol dehydrogenase family)
VIEQLFQLDGRVALVTGGSRGLGRQMATVLARAGAAVAVTSRKPETAAEAAAAIARETGARTLGVSAEATDEAQVEAAVEAVVAAFGSLDILVNNAGINLRKPIETFSLAEWEGVQAVNVRGPFLFTRYAVPHMRRRRWGRIINLCSILSFVSLPGRGAYSTSKAGLLGMTRAVALELAPDGITVNALCPGPCETDMNRTLKQDPEIDRFFTSRIPMGRWGKPEEMEGPVLFLASEASSFMTGQALIVDGGWTAQ